MKGNAYLLDAIKIVGPLIDASDATAIRLVEMIVVGRRPGGSWFIYNFHREIHFSVPPHTAKVVPFKTFADALAYLLSPDGQKLLDSLKIEWPLIRLPNDVRSDMPGVFGDGPDYVAPADIYKPGSNPLGALFVTAKNGKTLGVKPDEFEWVLTMDPMPVNLSEGGGT